MMGLSEKPPALELLHTSIYFTQKLDLYYLGPISHVLG